jgi:energy-converting hydrogenase Eha subunit F
MQVLLRLMILVSLIVLLGLRQPHNATPQQFQQQPTDLLVRTIHVVRDAQDRQAPHAGMELSSHSMMHA